MKTLILLSAFSLTASSLSAAAIAAPPTTTEAPITKVVQYPDLDLRSTVGQKQLSDRVSFAAYLVCLVDSPPSPSTAIVDPECFRSAMKDASVQMQRMIALANSGATVAAAATPSSSGNDR